ncbi:MAG: hypothetical protein V3W20_14760 [Candidatus Neomarinimicrobiota bacterium]
MSDGTGCENWEIWSDTGGTGGTGYTGGTGGIGNSGHTGGTGGAGHWGRIGNDLYYNLGKVTVGGTDGPGKFNVRGGSIFIDNSPPSNKQVYGIVTEMVIGEGVDFSNALFMKNDSKLWKADADATNSTITLVLAAEDSTADSTCMVLISGFARNDSWNFGIGNRIYVDTTAGLLTDVKPVGSGVNVQVVGVAFNTNLILFNPSFGYAIAGRYESTLLTGSTGYTGTHGIGEQPIIQVYDENYNVLQPKTAQIDTMGYQIDFEEITDCYVICMG